MGLVLGSKECQDYLLGQMEEGTEKIVKRGKQFPKANGLWNLCLREVGLLESTTIVVEAPQNPLSSDNKLTATVVVSITLRPYVGKLYPTSELSLPAEFDESVRTLSSDFLKFDGACNVDIYNTAEEGKEPIFHRFSVATAESIATSRALKKVLALNCHTAEETTTDIGNLAKISLDPPVEKMTAGQKKAILKKAETVGVNLESYMQGECKITMFEFEGNQVDKSIAEKTLTDFNNWEINPKKMPKAYKNV